MSLSAQQLPPNLALCGNEISCIIKTSLAPTTPNLEIECGINVELVYGSNVYTILTTQRLKPNANGECKFFWNQYLWDAFESQYDLPAIGGTASYVPQHAIRRYTFFAVEWSGDPQNWTDILSTGNMATVRHAVKGAISEARHAYRPYFGDAGWNLELEANGGLGRSFLDWRGKNPHTRTDFDQWLHWIYVDFLGYLGNGITVNYKVKWYRSDGTTGESTFLTLNGVDENDIYGLPAGFTQLGLSANETATDKITKYETWLSVDVLSNPVALTQIKTWHVDREYYELATQLQYINSLGVCEHLTLRGMPVVAIESEKERVSTYRDNSYARTQGQSEVIDVLVQTGYQMFTGNCHTYETKQVADIKAARRAWIPVESGNQQHLPLRITSGSTEYDFERNVHKYELQVVYDFDDKVPDLLI
jgi:hypothetical protein